MTAIDWLISKQKHNDFFDVETMEKAKEMEREQIMDAYRFGVLDEYVIGANKYYIEKYTDTDDTKRKSKRVS